MKKRAIAVIATVALAQHAQAVDVEAGKAKAATVCAACHGANGVSVSDTIPHLAGQREKYLEAQLRALKDGSRKNQIMNPIAGQLNAEDIGNLAAHFAAQPAVGAGARSDLLPHIARTRVSFPEGYDKSFTRYFVKNFPMTNQVRYYFANPVAVAAAKAGKPLPDGSVLFAEVHAAKLDGDKKPVVGSDGYYVADKLMFYTAMARDTGWGKEIPDMLRNDEWNYAVFTTEKKARPGVNQAECLACHKPLDAVSYTFTLKELAGAR